MSGEEKPHNRKGEKMSQPTCEDRIAKAWSRRKADLERCLYGPSEESGLAEYGLSFDFIEERENESIGYYRYQLSWGGPSDEIRFYEGGKATYHFMDWFDGASIDVSKSEVVADLREWHAIDFNRQRELMEC